MLWRQRGLDELDRQPRHGAAPRRPPAPVGLTNPVVREESALRTSLLPGLLGAARHNAAARNAAVRLFEIGRVFGRPSDDGELPVEREQLGVVLAGDGDGAPAAVHLWRRIVEGLGIDPGAVELAQDEPGSRTLLAGREAFGCQPTRTAVAARPRRTRRSARSAWSARSTRTSPRRTTSVPGGSAGSSSTRNVSSRSAAGTVARPRSAGSPRATSTCRSPSTSPSRRHDSSSSCGRRRGSTARASASSTSSAAPRSTPGSRSLTYRIRFIAPDRTLTDADVATARVRCIGAAEAELGAGLRG